MEATGHMFGNQETPLAKELKECLSQFDLARDCLTTLVARLNETFYTGHASKLLSASCMLSSPKYALCVPVGIHGTVSEVERVAATWDRLKVYVEQLRDILFHLGFLHNQRALDKRVFVDKFEEKARLAFNKFAKSVEVVLEETAFSPDGAWHRMFDEDIPAKIKRGQKAIAPLAREAKDKRERDERRRQVERQQPNMAGPHHPLCRNFTANDKHRAFP